MNSDPLATAIYAAWAGDSPTASSVVAKFSTMAAAVARQHLAEQVGLLRLGDAPYDHVADVLAWRRGVEDAEELIREPSE